MIIEWVPHTKREKQVVKEFGNKWRFESKASIIHFLNGPGVLISANTQNWRWIKSSQVSREIEE